nr:MAG TPA: hypothetical protein [Caudoviricetes sp.]
MGYIPILLIIICTIHDMFEIVFPTKIKIYYHSRDKCQFYPI